ncbi:MAG: hypothetical protein ACXAC7_16685, partial [Candidatus Hodarchaeales archaeon]
EPVFLNDTQISSEKKEKIINAFDNLKNHQLPSLEDQIGWEPRKQLDLAFIDVFNLIKPTEFLDIIYQEITRLFKEFTVRGKKRRGRK